MCITEFDEKIYTEGIREEGREEGLEALVSSLKDFVPNFDMLYMAVTKNETYKNATREQVQKYYNL